LTAPPTWHTFKTCQIKEHPIRTTRDLKKSLHTTVEYVESDNE
ncbi:6927_t:CDS:1, partial [Cetraspora pellucida]